MKYKHRLIRLAGAAGSLAFIAAFIYDPSFPTPDKLFVFLLFVFMALDQARDFIFRFLPFTLILLIYESFRSIADDLNKHVDFNLPPDFDKWLFGKLPTDTLQRWLWHGYVRWYDYVFYLAYMMHFVLPVGMAILIWKTRDRYYWRFVCTYLVTSFAAFITFLVFPAAPPWMAAQQHVIGPITRISSHVWSSLGLKDFPSFYDHISANPVAAVPSLHAAWATLLLIFVYKLYGWRWSILAAVYPFLIYVGTVYQGEHYAFDELTGILYAVACYKLTPYVMSWVKKFWFKFRAYSSSTRTSSRSAR